MTPHIASSAVSHLIALFSRDLPAKTSSAYNEAEVRREFIEPLFEALGWDVSNRAGYSDEYKDVRLEDAISIPGSANAPFDALGLRSFSSRRL